VQSNLAVALVVNLIGTILGEKANDIEVAFASCRLRPMLQIVLFSSVTHDRAKLPKPFGVGGNQPI
jgi:hypothetical protein